MCAVPTTFLQAGAIWLRKGNCKSMRGGRQGGGKNPSPNLRNPSSRMPPPSASGKGVPRRRQLHGSKKASDGVKTEVRNQPVGEGGAPVGMTCRQAAAATSPRSGRRKARKNV